MINLEQLDKEQALRLRILEQLMHSSLGDNSPKHKLLDVTDEFVNYILVGKVKQENK